MAYSFAEPSLKRFVAWTAAPVMLLGLAAAALVAGLLIWSAGESDLMAMERQERLVRLVVSQLEGSIAHDQESATVWDDAVQAVRDPDRAAWIDANLGTWMHSYFGHDGTYILDSRDEPIYAFADGAVAKPAAYWRIGRSAAPLVTAIRDKLRRSDMSGTSAQVLSPGVADIAVVEGRPAVISLKPIVSDTGAIAQVPGEEYLHVAVRFLDGSFLDGLQRDYLFDGLRFSWNGELAPGEAGIVLSSASGRRFGHLVWRPYKPGTAVMAFMVPVLIALFITVGLALALLIARLRRRSLRLRDSEHRLHHLAMHDPLTGLPNRATLDGWFETHLTHAAEGAAVAALYLDLDRFKQVNDTLGHPVGDELIRQVALRLRGLLRPGDMVARIGGDEFAVGLAGVTEAQGIESLCERIIEAVGQPFHIEGTQISIGASIGIALAPRDGSERTVLLRRADIALYHAKNAGRGRFAMFDPAMDAVVQARRAVEEDLRAALAASDQLQVVFQPLFGAASGRITGAEALARWRHPEQGWVAPGEFIPIAEETGLIERLGEHTLRMACRAAAWPIEKVAVNVSAVELRNPHYAVKVAGILLSAGMTASRLELEVTESTFAGEDSACEANIRALRELGVRIALDDFGTGFSSLARLRRLPVDRIKIDRSFVQDCVASAGGHAIVQAIIALARATGLKVTAEGVETAKQAAYLRRVGCDDLQGFLLAKPMPAAELESLLLLDAGAARTGSFTWN